MRESSKRPGFPGRFCVFCFSEKAELKLCLFTEAWTIAVLFSFFVRTSCWLYHLGIFAANNALSPEFILKAKEGYES